MKHWRKTGAWRMAANDGPYYMHESGRAVIRGSWGVVGDNARGWRKRQRYTLAVDGLDVDYGNLRRLFAVAVKAVAKSAQPTIATTATIHSTATVHPSASVGEGANVGEGSGAR